MQISLLLASATSTALAAITCNVPDNKPSSIPLGCQVCLDSIIISNNSSTWPTAKLALQEIRGRLVVQAAIPEHLDIPLTVETLELHGALPSELEINRISAKVLHVNRVCNFPVVEFDSISPDVVIFEESYVQLYGVSSERISQLSAHVSIIYNTEFPNLKRVGSISLFKTMLDSEMFPALEEAHSVKVDFTQMRTLSLPVTKVTGTVEIANNFKLTMIAFPGLKKIGGDFLVYGPGQVQSLTLPQLKEVNYMAIQSKTNSLEMPQDVAWSTKSYFNVPSFCEKHAPALNQAKLGFISARPCQS
ncbi:hypothetical protein DSO57_1008262 [Entomophthora muscae]|uniref:Uncharacterized protein n=1 Tax=Entomophthora muscae TaxID=34485 RepID=A0ACC2UG76_9FUNG|nr:hypothetical protein DSO57_1008262 [Entomophthora muscae]